MQAFCCKRCHFLKRYQKTKKPKILESWRRRVQNLCFFLFFWYPSRKMQAFGGKRCRFLRRYQKNQKTKKILESWRRRGLKSPKSLFFFVFLVLLQEKASLCGKRCNFLRRYQINQESWRRRGLKSPKSLFFFVFLFFLVLLQENASFLLQTLPFPEEVPKNKKPKILESWRRRGLKSPKSLVCLVFWYPSRKMQAFGGKRCHFLRKYKIK